MYCVHDLLEIDVSSLLDDGRMPAWVGESLRACPWVVVRRGVLSCHGQLLVGMRGGSRSERFAATIEETAVRRRVTSASLIQRIHAGLRASPLPGLALLPELPEMLAGWSWGLGGSVGFHLATGVTSVTATSDIDILLYPRSLFLRADAEDLLERMRGVMDRADVLIETAAGAYALSEYASGGPMVVCRTGRGPVIVPHPDMTFAAAERA